MDFFNPIEQLFIQQPTWFYSSIFLLGLLVGSFLNVVIYRYPIMLKKQWKSECTNFLHEQKIDKENVSDENQNGNSIIATDNAEAPFNLVHPRSKCPHCQHQITALENIPIISWLILKGKCSSCKSSISIRYPFIELLTAVLSLLVALQFGYGINTLLLLGFTWSLICLSFIDFDTQLLPDDITLPLLWAGLLMSLFSWSPVSVSNALIGAIAGYLALWSVYKLFKLITGKEGMGYGDFKLLAALGAWLGWQMLPLTIFLSAFVGAIFGLSMMVFLGKDKNIPIPFGPYLATAGFIALLFGHDLNRYYLSALGLG